MVRFMKARAALANHHEAGKYAAMAEVAYAPPSDPESGVLRSSEEIEYAAVEAAAALCLTRYSSERQLSLAVSLSDRLRRVSDLFATGALDLPRVRVFEYFLGHLPEEVVGVVLDECLDDAPAMSTGQLRARISKLVMKHDPDGSKASYEVGLSERHLLTGANPDHTANFGIYSAAPDRVAAARDFVERRARALKSGGEDRTLEQLRVDVALDLLAGNADFSNVTRGGGRTNVTISAETLLGMSDEPAELDGFGPVIAEIGRKTALENIEGEWTFTVTDQGRPVATGTLAAGQPLLRGDVQRPSIQHVSWSTVGSRLSTATRPPTPRFRARADRRGKPRTPLPAPSQNPAQHTLAVGASRQRRSQMDQPTWAHLPQTTRPAGLGRLCCPSEPSYHRFTSNTRSTNR